MKANILVDQDGHARLAGLELVTIVSDQTGFITSESVTSYGISQWMSPELIHPDQFSSYGGRPTKASDCYALGMVIYEVLTGRAPFAPLKAYIIVRMVIDGERPGRPGGVNGIWFTDNLWKMLGLCWATDSHSRPSIEAVLECLEQVSGTWKPLPPQVNEGVEEDENDWDLTVLMVSILF